MFLRFTHETPHNYTGSNPVLFRTHQRNIINLVQNNSLSIPNLLKKHPNTIMEPSRNYSGSITDFFWNFPVVFFKHLRSTLKSFQNYSESFPELYWKHKRTVSISELLWKHSKTSSTEFHPRSTLEASQDFSWTILEPLQASQNFSGTTPLHSGSISEVFWNPLWNTLPELLWKRLGMAIEDPRTTPEESQNYSENIPVLLFWKHFSTIL